MAGGGARASVKKNVRMEPRLAGAISAWAEGAGVGFSEAVLRLCAQGLATWPGSPLAAPAGSGQEIVNEVRRAKEEAVTELKAAIDDAVDEVVFGKDGL